MEAKLQRLLASQDKLKKERVEMEKQLSMMNGMKDEAVSKVDEMRKENEQMRIEIRTLEAKVCNLQVGATWLLIPSQNWLGICS